MDLDPGTVAIIQLAWSRGLGLEDGALAEAEANERLFGVGPTPHRLYFVRLFGREVISGPEWAADFMRSEPTADLSSNSTLMRFSQALGGRALGTQHLYFADALPTLFPGEEYAVSEEREMVTALEQRCPPDDVAEASLADREATFTLVDDSDEEPQVLSGAGYTLREGILADMAVLTEPSFRCKGLGSYISAVAVEDAMATGLVPQWRVRSGNVGASRTAAGSGFVPAGLYAAVELPAA